MDYQILVRERIWFLFIREGIFENSMFIIVKYGNNETLLCNPSCAIVNLLTSIKRRAGYGNSNVTVDLSDETGTSISKLMWIWNFNKTITSY